MTQTLIPTWVLGAVVAALGVLGFLFIGTGSASAANLYWVGTTAADYSDATNWNTSDPGSCNDGGGDAGAAPGGSDVAILDADCDTDLLIPDDTDLQGLTLSAGYTGDVDQDGTLNVLGDVLIASGSELNSDGNDLAVSGDWTNGGDYVSGANTVFFDDESTIDTGGTGTENDFNNVTITGEVELSGNAIDVDNNFTIGSDGHISLSGEDFTVSGTFSNEGGFEFSGAETVSFTNDTDSGSIVYFDDGGNSRNLGGLTTFYSVSFNDDGSDGDWTLTANIDVNGNLTIEGGTLDADTYDINVGGDFENDDTFTDGSGTVTLDGTGSQAVTGSTEFYDFSATASSTARTVTFGGGDTFTFANSLTLTGTADYLLSVQSYSDSAVTTFSPGSSTVTVSYMSPYRVSVSGTTITCTTGCVNRGFNDGWVIASNSSSVGSGSSTVSSVANILSPSNGDRVTAGGSADIEWSASYEGLDSVALYYSIDNGANWTLIEEGISNSGTYDWDVPEATSLLAKVRVIAYDADGNELIQDSSNNVFVIEEGDGSEDQGSSEDEDESEEEEDTFSGISVRNSAGADVMLSAGGLFRGESLSGVYLVNNDGSRWVFPTEHVFNSYGYSFDDVETLADDQLMKFRLGGRVVAAPGELIKIQSDNRVFEVQDDGVLRHVPSEVYARENYGDNWNQMITDINVLFWGDYTIGDPLE